VLTTFSDWSSPGVSLAYWLEYRYASAGSAGSVPVHGVLFLFFYNAAINVWLIYYNFATYSVKVDCLKIFAVGNIGISGRSIDTSVFSTNCPGYCPQRLVSDDVKCVGVIVW